MKKVVVIMNTDRVGGAERSLLLQLITQSENAYQFLIPNVSGSKQLENLVKSYGFSDVRYYHYPHAVYNLSRASSKFSFKVFVGLLDAVFGRNDFKEILSADVVYLNGTKAAFLFFLKNTFLKFNKKVVWHFRDYWHQDAYASFLWKHLNNVRPENLQLVCNSHSTLASLDNSLFEKNQKTVIYNPSGLASVPKKTKPVKTLGFVSMLAPWKGIHEVILWAKLYEKELIDLGIEKIKFFGADLYVTDGEHVGYAQQLNSLLEKLKPKLVSFEGHCEPAEIFSNIDCLIHYSLEAEPFGRVIIEAFHHRVPTISTGLGGASELIEDEHTGLKMAKYDKHGLFTAVQKIVTNEKFRQNIIENAFNKSLGIENSIDEKMHEVLKEVAVW